MDIRIPVELLTTGEARPAEVAHVLGIANTAAEAAGVNVADSIVSIREVVADDGPVWRVNYGTRDFINQRGGDVIVEVIANGSAIKRVLHGQ